MKSNLQKSRSTGSLGCFQQQEDPKQLTWPVRMRDSSIYLLDDPYSALDSRVAWRCHEEMVAGLQLGGFSIWSGFSDESGSGRCLAVQPDADADNNDLNHSSSEFPQFEARAGSLPKLAQNPSIDQASCLGRPASWR